MQQVACLSNKKSHLATSCAMLNMFNFEQLVAQTIQLAETGNKLHGNELHVWKGLYRSTQLVTVRVFDVIAIKQNPAIVCFCSSCSVLCVQT